MSQAILEARRYKATVQIIQRVSGPLPHGGFTEAKGGHSRQHIAFNQIQMMKFSSWAAIRPAFSILLTAVFFCSAIDRAPAQTALVTYTNTTALIITTNIAVPGSSGTTYVLEKYSPGQLTLDGNLTGGAGSILRMTTQTSGDSTTVFEFAENNSGYAGGIQTWRGIIQVDNSLSLGTGTIYCDGNGSTSGDLRFNGNMTFTNLWCFKRTVQPSRPTPTVSYY
jgi:hypothetical protein